MKGMEHSLQAPPGDLSFDQQHQTPGDSMKLSIRSNDLSDKLKSCAVELARDAKRSLIGNQEIAKKIKTAFDSQFGGTWHCIVGSDFGSFITHEVSGMIFFYLGKDAFLLWKTI